MLQKQNCSYLQQQRKEKRIKAKTGEKLSLKANEIDPIESDGCESWKEIVETGAEELSS